VEVVRRKKERQDETQHLDFFLDAENKMLTKKD
jgi:hypothetical protein